MLPRHFPAAVAVQAPVRGAGGGRGRDSPISGLGGGGGVPARCISSAVCVCLVFVCFVVFVPIKSVAFAKSLSLVLVRGTDAVSGCTVKLISRREKCTPVSTRDA